MSKRAYVKAYPQEFRDKVVQLMQVGERSPRQVAEEFGISEDSVRRWVQQAEREQGQRQDGLRSVEREELIRLRRENRRLKQDSKILRGASHRLARDLASGSEPIKGQAVLVLTENGWMHAAMFGK